MSQNCDSTPPPHDYPRNFDPPTRDVPDKLDVVEGPLLENISAAALINTNPNTPMADSEAIIIENISPISDTMPPPHQSPMTQDPILYSATGNNVR